MPTEVNQLPQAADLPRGQSALAGIRVLDLSRFIAGPYCAMMLGDMGADVLKIEKPGSGDAARTYRPQVNGNSVYSMMFNRNKRGVALDLRKSGDLDVLKSLIERADVLIENYRPGTMEKMGLGWEQLQLINPRLVMTRISGFGQDGPWASLPCFDGIAQAAGGLMELTGDPEGPPTLCGTYVCDYTAGMYAAMGTLAALNARHTAGRGQVVDVSLLDSAASLLMSAIPEYYLLDNKMTRRGSRDRYATPNNVYKTVDGSWVYLVCGGKFLFPRFAKAIQRLDLLDNPDFATLEARLLRWNETETIARDWVGKHTVDQVLRVMTSEDVPCGKVATIEDVVNNPQLRHRKQILELDDPVAGKIPMQGVTIQMSETPLSIRLPMPAVGQHTAEVLAEWLDVRPAAGPAIQEPR
jgi:crotonobetainyl-CoA:carnitine CoA-transferase CaiB-like acyl-CoA transferase